MIVVTGNRVEGDDTKKITTEEAEEDRNGREKMKRYVKPRRREYCFLTLERLKDEGRTMEDTHLNACI